MSSFLSKFYFLDICPLNIWNWRTQWQQVSSILNFFFCTQWMLSLRCNGCGFQLWGASCAKSVSCCHTLFDWRCNGYWSLNIWLSTPNKPLKHSPKHVCTQTNNSQYVIASNMPQVTLPEQWFYESEWNDDSFLYAPQLIVNILSAWSDHHLHQIFFSSFIAVPKIALVQHK